MGQNFIKKNLWVHIHGIYYIVKIDNQILLKKHFYKTYHF